MGTEYFGQLGTGFILLFSFGPCRNFKSNGASHSLMIIVDKLSWPVSLSLLILEPPSFCSIVRIPFPAQESGECCSFCKPWQLGLRQGSPETLCDPEGRAVPHPVGFSASWSSLWFCVPFWCHLCLLPVPPAHVSCPTCSGHL